MIAEMANPPTRIVSNILAVLPLWIMTPTIVPPTRTTIRNPKPSLGVRTISFFSNPSSERKFSRISEGMRLAKEFTVELFMTSSGLSVDWHLVQIIRVSSKSNTRSLIGCLQTGHFGFLKSISDILRPPAVYFHTLWLHLLKLPLLQCTLPKPRA